MIKRFVSILGLGALLVACTNHTPEEAYYKRGQPESLIEESSRVVNIKVSSPTSVQDIVDFLSKEQPTRALVDCKSGDSLCKEIKSVMRQFKVAAKYRTASDNKVSLIYEKVQARDCQHRYIDRPENYDNINSPTFGCSIAVNIVQMVSDKRQFTNPAYMTTPDVSKAMQAIQNYNVPATIDANSSGSLIGGGSGSSGGSR